jgi:hypothetical protein
VFDAPEGLARPPQRQDLLSSLFVQDVHLGGGSRPYRLRQRLRYPWWPVFKCSSVPVLTVHRGNQAFTPAPGFVAPCLRHGMTLRVRVARHVEGPRGGQAPVGLREELRRTVRQLPAVAEDVRTSIAWLR